MVLVAAGCSAKNPSSACEPIGASGLTVAEAGKWFDRYLDRYLDIVSGDGDLRVGGPF